LRHTKELVDFSSNDYLGFSSSKSIFKRTSEILKAGNFEKNGATGSRLLTGNHLFYTETEAFISRFHNCEATLIFNSGYDANVGFFGCIPQRGDLIFYDELCHASIRDGIQLSPARAFKYKHNNLNDLKNRIRKIQSDINDPQEIGEVYIVTESVFSMDGDVPDLAALVEFSKTNNLHLIVDEAHALGVIGTGKGVLQEQGLEAHIFSRVVTFGKALGCHGAAILGSEALKQYLVNFARSCIYSTALPPHTIATIQAAYEQISVEEDIYNSTIIRLQHKSKLFQNFIVAYQLEN
jgi:8-amino-7-oxononanoate synthase